MASGELVTAETARQERAHQQIAQSSFVPLGLRGESLKAKASRENTRRNGQRVAFALCQGSWDKGR